MKGLLERCRKAVQPSPQRAGLITLATVEGRFAKWRSPVKRRGASVAIEKLDDGFDPSLIPDKRQRPELGSVVDPVLRHLLIAITELRRLESKFNVADGLYFRNPSEYFCRHVFSVREQWRPLIISGR